MAVCAARPAAAGTINTYEVTFGATGFYPTPSAPASGLVLGQFHITLDTSQTTFNGTSGLTLDFVNVALDSAFAYTYNFFKSDRLEVGGLASDVSGVGLAHTDFDLVIDGFASGNPVFQGFVFSDQSRVYLTNTGEVHVTQLVPAVSVAATPLPAALPLFVSALGGLGFFGWRRRISAA